MIIKFHKKFLKALEKQSKNIQKKFKVRLKLFQNNQFHHLLNNHALSGKFIGVRSFNITGDIRVHYEETKEGIILLDIGSHSDLY
jgi:addiction module RelE/StbE family toxin